LEQVEDDVWGDPPPDATRLMTTVHNLRRVPLGQLGPEDLRILIAQGIGHDVLIPRTLTLLEHNPLLEGDFFPSDVLAAILKAPRSYWAANPNQATRVEHIVAALDDGTTADLKSEIDNFRSQHG
jgi:hypothetical protein